jgi:hypothetical protein
MCGGIPSFLAAWDGLNQTMFRLERTPPRDGKREKLYRHTIDDAQRLIDLVCVSPEDGGKITVTEVAREYHGNSGQRTGTPDLETGWENS